jgi:hypothetical protein
MKNGNCTPEKKHRVKNAQEKCIENAPTEYYVKG